MFTMFGDFVHCVGSENPSSYYLSAEIKSRHAQIPFTYRREKYGKVVQRNTIAIWPI